MTAGAPWTSPIPPGPLVELPGLPILFPTLGVSFQLSSLEPSDVPALEAANEMILDWLGGSLKWTLNSTVKRIERFEPDDLSFASSYAEQLEIPRGREDPQEEEFVQLMAAATANEFGLYCHGGLRPNHGSPFSCAFYSEVIFIGGGPHFTTSTVLRITVPTDWPLDDFHRRVHALASVLRLRWGSAGFTYSGYAIDFWERVHEGIHAHARRHLGFDPGYYVSFMPAWYESLRTVNWLTFLGDELRTRVEKRKGGLPPPDALLGIYPAGPNLVLQAGAHPIVADVNRREHYGAYARADEIVRPVRARGGVHFLAPWSDATTERWLRRFERRIT
jgi:hypothetical protein